jgi:RNA polymerase sigma-70 factor (sigma-E family)
MVQTELDEADFSAFVHAAWPALYRTAVLLVGDRGLAEDLVQTALAKTYLSWGRIRDRGAAGVYTRTVLVNTATSWFRKRGWRNELATGQLTEHAGRSHIVPGPDEDGPLLRAALLDLPRRQRAVVVLRFYEDRSVEEVAAILQVSTGTVKSQTSHALAKLRTALGGSFSPLPEGASHD